MKQETESHMLMTCQRMFNKQGKYLKTSLRIHSPVLIQALQDCIVPSRCVWYSRLYAPRVSIHKPYMILFENRSNIQHAIETWSETRPEDVAQLKFLLGFMEEAMPSTWAKLCELEASSCHYIAFEDVWLLYPPGTTVYERNGGFWYAYKVDTVVARPGYSSSETLYIRCYYLEFNRNGSRLVPAREILRVSPFRGIRAISDLTIIPESHITSFTQDIPTRLHARGKKYWGFNGEPAYQEYTGSVWPTTLSTVF